MRNFRTPKLVVLMILDGWGIAPPGPGNAITAAKTPSISGFGAVYPHTQLTASGEGVGLPRGEPGNTETGHLNIGAGQIVYQDLLRINMAIADGSFFKNDVLDSAIKHVDETGGNLHLMGLIGAGGVHSNLEHLFALMRYCKQMNFNRLFLHLFTDGRDSPPTGAATYLAQINSVIQNEGVGKIATLTGRYFAMDRDSRWDRTEKAYRAITQGIGVKATNPDDAIQDYYSKNITDEFIEPTVFTYGDDKPVGLVKEGDSVIFFNFRIDRPRQLTKCFVLDDFEAKANLTSDFDPFAIKYYKKHESEQSNVREPFKRGEKIKNLFFTTLTEYQKGLPVHVAFPPTNIRFPMGRVLSERGVRQLRVSESEKERFVTYYFNGQRDLSFPGEEHLIIPSPKVATYDLAPEMSARELTKQVMLKMNSLDYTFILINFANADMVGHTGNFQAAVKAVEVIDECVGNIVRLSVALGGCSVITADHGNAEEMVNLRTSQVDTEHSSFPVPFIIIYDDFKRTHYLPRGILADVAPTILHIMDIPKPQGMLGRNLLI